MTPTRESGFTGPVFVVGMPRSGTKLLRELLNNHPQIGIIPNESHCIPYFYRRIDRYGDLRDFRNFGRFYTDFSRTLFFRRLAEREPLIEKSAWYKEVDEWSYPGVIATFYRAYARKHHKSVWGDKTPSYLLHMPLLKRLFPSAKFIHIIRDARDCCLSIHKAWGTNIYRAAQRWHDFVGKCRGDAREFLGEDYFEVRYERLLDSPEDTLGAACHFLGIPYEPVLLAVDKPIENLGSAKNVVGILENNYGKWKQYTGAADMDKIERICSPLLSELGYPLSRSCAPLSLSRVEMFAYKVLDGWNQLRLECQAHSLGNVLRDAFKSKMHCIVGRRK